MTAIVEKRIYSLDEAAYAYSTSRRRLQQAIDEHKLVAHYNGSRVLLSIADLDEWFASLPTERS
jgi:excisionase family DNA binding protein